MKKIISIVLILVMCLGLVACGGSAKSKEYKNAVRRLESILEYTCFGYTKSELYEPSLLDLSIDTYEYTDFVSLYQDLSELGDYKEAKEILGRFSIVENGHITIKYKGVADAFGQVDTHDYGAVLLDEEGRISVIFNSVGTGTMHVYDDQGNLIRECGGLFHMYDSQGKRIETRAYKKTGGGTIKSITTYSYDAQGSCVEATTKNYDGTTDTFTYTYDEKGNCIEKLTTNANGVAVAVAYTYIYDEQGNCLFKFSNENIDEGYPFTIYSKTGSVIYATNSIPSDTEITDYNYENGMPASITFSDGSELTFEYSSAYFFDVEGFVLPEV